ncbi:DUF4383 domain-containing protein [Azoarcus sp. KH32C]|uniref:DUF4383 domain-containing protein n=1 Tax=Azoarcus sp. KH32C TaxID=748247 RepID=UPI0002386DAC|nr:DUF4383 domain-containing protein [Azoarcus sp. KH32C]BAL24928.1 hypothetical protein AZKH_2622 [Azoarcus sp. KH32C]
MLRRAALIFGAAFIVAGLLGFVEAVAPHRDPGGDALLFGIFAVNPIHNAVHLISGIVAIIVGLRSDAASATYFRVFGLIYGLVTIAGIFVGHGLLLGMAHNPADVACTRSLPAQRCTSVSDPFRTTRGTRRITPDRKATGS